MSRPIPERVLTLAEAAKFLRAPVARIRELAEDGTLPGRKIGDDWRFLKSMLVDWLRGKPCSAELFLRQAGSFKDDDTLAHLREDIYKARRKATVGAKD